MPEMSFTSPDSSTIVAATYDPDAELMKVHFRRKGGVVLYHYKKVPFDLWERFAAADSKGAFFNREIRPIYDGIQPAHD